jgi:hypothetical protein
MDVNDNALNLMPRGVLTFFASRLAPTGDAVISAGTGESAGAH